MSLSTDCCLKFSLFFLFQSLSINMGNFQNLACAVCLCCTARPGLVAGVPPAAELGVWVPTAHGDPLHTALGGGTPCTRLLALQGKTTICPQVIDWIEQYMGNYRETLVKMKELARKEVLKKHEDLQLVDETLGWKWRRPLKYVWWATLLMRWCIWFDLWLHSKSFRQIQSEVYAGFFCWSRINFVLQLIGHNMRMYIYMYVCMYKSTWGWGRLFYLMYTGQNP